MNYTIGQKTIKRRMEKYQEARVKKENFALTIQLIGGIVLGIIIYFM